MVILCKYKIDWKEILRKKWIKLPPCRSIVIEKKERKKCQLVVYIWNWVGFKVLMTCEDLTQESM